MYRGMKFSLPVMVCLGSLVGFCGVSETPAQTTAFTYQGQLKDGAVAANGVYDLRFALFTVSSGGSGATLEAPATPVTNGLFTVTLDYGSGWLGGADRWLQISVRTNGSPGAYTDLLPRQRLASTPYAWRAAVANSVPTGAITSGMLAGGAVTAGHFAPGAVVAGLANEGLSGVPTSQALVMSSLANDPGLLANGYVRVGNNLSFASEVWSPVAVPDTTSTPIPWPRYGVWTGTEFIGLSTSGYGARYNPASGLWTALALPAGWSGQRLFAAVVWTGTEMIIWGGRTGNTSPYNCPNTGFRYNPTSNTWTAMRADATAPSGRFGASAVWTGSRMVIWGGLDPAGTALNTGSRYNPVTDTWSATRADATTPPAAATSASVWTGSRMLVWSGYKTSPTFSTSTNGGSYDPVADTWTPINPVGAPRGVGESAAVWTGTKLIVWSGSTNGGYRSGVVNTGGIYDPIANTWSPMLGTPPAARMLPVCVWNGTNMLVWGGAGENVLLPDGKSFHPVTGWGANLNPNGAPLISDPPFPQLGAWLPGTSELLVVAGTGGRYSPGNNSWTPVSLNYPDGQTRRDHVAIWTGSEMIVWGGTVNGLPTDTGRRYNPTTGGWTNTSLVGAPSPRWLCSGVWSGTELIIWGGTGDGFTPLDDGARYNPVTDTWTPISPAPSQPVSLWGTSLRTGRFGHAAVWTSAGMLVWGGSDGYDNQGSTLTTIGGIYHPATDSWSPLDAADYDVPSRCYASAVFVSPRVYFFGGRNLPTTYGGPTALVADAVAYDVENENWWTLPAAPQTLAREGFSLTGAGNRIALWGGRDGVGNPLATGLVFNTVSNTWTLLTANNAPTARSGHTAVWTGRELLVWGGTNAAGLSLTNGAHLELDAPQWTSFGTNRSIAAGHSAIWSGSEMILYGNLPGLTDQCARYHPGLNAYYYIRP